MRSDKKLLGLTCLTVACLAFAAFGVGHAQDAGQPPDQTAAPGAGQVGGVPPTGSVSSAPAAGGAPAGDAAAPGGLPPGADPSLGQDAGGAPAGAAPAAGNAGGGAPPGLGDGGAPGAASASAGGGMPPGMESNTPAPSVAPSEAASTGSQAQAAAAAALEQKRAQQEADDRAATEAAAVAADKVPTKPRSAFMVPLAAHDLMLDVVKAGDHLVAVGSHGDIITSADGTQWTQSQSPVRELLTAVTFVDARNGWAVGHDAVIVHSGDGGKTWALQAYQPQLQSPLLNVFFLDAQHGFAMGAFGQLRETSDGGATWNDVSADSIRGPQLNFYGMTRLGDGNLLIAGEQGMLGLSTDQGATWQKLNSPYKGSFFGVLPAGDHGALLFGLRGNVYISDDAGKGPWRQVETHSKASFFGGIKQADGSFLLVGSAGTIMRVNADGSSATSVPGPGDHDYDAAVPLGPGLVLAGASGMQLLKSLR